MSEALEAQGKPKVRRPKEHREKRAGILDSLLWRERSRAMLALKYLLMILGTLLFGSAAGLVAYDIFLSTQLRRLLRRGLM